MSTSQDLMGYGMNFNLAGRLGNDPNVLTTTGTAQATAALIKSHLTELLTAGSQTGAIFPAGASVGTPFWVNNPTATTGVVYVPSGQTLNGSLNGSLNLAQNKAAVFVQYKKGFWFSILTA